MYTIHYIHTYRSVYDKHRLFRKPPLLGPPLSCGKLNKLWSQSYWRQSAGPKNDLRSTKGCFGLVLQILAGFGILVSTTFVLRQGYGQQWCGKAYVGDSNYCDWRGYTNAEL